MRNLNEEDFSTLWPEAPAALVSGILSSQGPAWASCQIRTDLRLAHFLAQISLESNTGRSLVENLNYSAEGLRSTWPSHFSEAQAEEYGRTDAHPANQRMTRDLAYGGRMGNAPYPSDDGYNFRGRGLLQVTGKQGYSHLGVLCGLDLVGHPDLISDPMHALLVAATEFKASGCLPYCDADNLLAVSSLVNVGHIVSDSSEINGYAGRQEWLAKWKKQLGI